MIRCFRKGLRPSIQAQLDTRGKDLDSWEEAIEKTVNAKVKASLQSPASTRDMESRCPQGSRLAKREEKDSGGKNKSTNSTPVDTSSGKQSSSARQTSFANPKRDQDHQ